MATRSSWWAVPFLMVLVSIGCTASRTVPVRTLGTTELVLGNVAVVLDAALPEDRARSAVEVGLGDRVSAKVIAYLRAAGLWSPSAADRLEIDIDRFRLPRVARWMTGQLKGNDNLGGQIRILKDEGKLDVGHAFVQLGAGDRSIGANYSADWALGSLVDQFSWEVVWALTGIAGEGEAPLLEAGKESGIEKAVNVLGNRGMLSYGEAAKFAASGKLDASVAAKYDACSARAVFTVGLSKCKWDQTYRGDVAPNP